MRALVLFLLLAIVGCASKGPQSDERGRSLSPRLSAIEIDYIRGNNLHRFIAKTEAEAEKAKVEMFRDKTLTRTGRIDRGKFLELAKQAEQLMASNQAAADLSTCRTPFVLRITSDADTKKVEGCRSAEEGAAVGRLIREAEFLVLSQD